MSLPGDLQTLLNAGRVSVRGLIRLSFGTGTYGVWNGTGPFTYSGVTYKANAQIAVEEIGAGIGSQASQLRIILPASADFGVAPDRLAGIEDEDYKGRAVVIYDAYFHPDTRALLHVEPMFEGYVDTIEHVVEGGQRTLVAQVETAALDSHRDGYRLASHEDQQLVSAGDRFFEHAATAGIETFEVTLD